MGEWILLKSESELEAKAKALRKKCRGHYYTNYYFIHSTRNNDLRYTEIFYREDGDNLYAIERMDEHYQLFYFVGDVESVHFDLPLSVDNGVLTCEIDEEEGKEKQGLVLEKLYEFGFAEYKKYHFYVRKGGDFPRFHRKGFDTTYQASIEELSSMYDIFDLYSDGLPLRKSFQEYLESMDILSCAVNGQYIGSSFHRKNENGNPYTFVNNKFAGAGVYLLSARLECDTNECPNKILWSSIEDNNIKSIRLSELFGYTRTKQYHKVLIRRSR